MGLASSLDQPDTPSRPAAQRLREALSLFEDGVEMKRRNLKRRFPEASEVELEERLLSWLQSQDAS
jgi:hypothetical protein